MATRFSMPRNLYFDGNGDARAGAKLYFYETGTTTALDTYSNNALTSANANPVVADADGLFGEIFLKAQDYKVILKTSADVTIYTADPVSGGAPAGGGVLSKSGAYIVTTGDDGKYIEADASGGDFTVTLLAATTAGDGFRIGVKNNGASGNVTIDGNAAETIDGAATIILSKRYQSVMLRCDGVEWHVESSVGITTGAFGGNNVAPTIDDILIDGTPDTDHTSNGPTTSTFVSAGSTTVMDLVYLNSSGKWALTDADAVATAGGVMLGISLESKTADQAMTVAMPGSFVRDDTWNWTPGATLYVSETAGAISASVPTGVDGIVRVVGFAVTADVIWFEPSASYVTTDASGTIKNVNGIAAVAGALTLIGSATASNSASLTVTGLTGKPALIIGVDLAPQTDNVDGWLRIGDSGGVDSGASDYSWAADNGIAADATATGVTSPTFDTEDAAAQINMMGAATDGAGNSTNEAFNFRAMLLNGRGTVGFPCVEGRTVFRNLSTWHVKTEFFGARIAAITTDRVNFLFSSGNIVSGSIYVYEQATS